MAIMFAEVLMADPVTIDNFDVVFHERYASDQAQLDTKYIEETGQISPHFDVTVSSTALLTKWEELFGVQLVHPWATFAKPPNYLKLRKRFFVHALSEQFDWEEEEEQDDVAQEYAEKIKGAMCEALPKALFERDRSSLLKLLGSIKELNGLLKHIHGRKLQYQKG